MNPWSALIALVVGTAMGFAAGLHSALGDLGALRADLGRIEARVNAPKADRSARTLPACEVPALDPAVLRSEVASAVRDVLQDELPGLAQASMTPAAEPSSEPASTELSAGQIKAEGAAERLVASAKQQRLWSSQDAEELRGLFQEMTHPQQQRLMHMLVPAINQGDLQLEGPLL